MSEPMIVTVLVLSYNNGNYIYDTIDSILIQTYGDIELIISDDASASFDIKAIAAYIEKHQRPNIKNVIYNQNTSNLQTVAHVEKLLPMCNGKFITMIAADDAYNDKDVIEKMMNCFVHHPELDVVMGHTAMYDQKLEKSISIFTSQENVDIINSGNNKHVFEQLAVKPIMPAMGVIYRKNVLWSIGTLSDRYRLVEDWPIHLRIVQNQKQIYFLDIIAGKHRDGGISHGNIQGKNEASVIMREDLLRVMEMEIFPFILNCDLSTQTEIRRMYYERIKMFEREKERMEKNQKEDEIAIDNKKINQTLATQLPKTQKDTDCELFRLSFGRKILYRWDGYIQDKAKILERKRYLSLMRLFFLALSPLAIYRKIKKVLKNYD